MNEKLFNKALDLSNQASDWVDETHPYAGYEPKAWNNHHRTKFAELIIKDCLNITAQFEKSTIGAGITEQIKEHFGLLDANNE